MKAKLTEPGSARGNPRDDHPWQASFTQLRESFGLSRAILKRALHASDTALAKWEKGTTRPPPDSIAEIKRLKKIVEGLAGVMKKKFIPTWLRTPNDGCEGKAPLDLLAEGDYEYVEDLVYFLEAGEPV